VTVFEPRPGLSPLGDSDRITEQADLKDGKIVDFDIDDFHIKKPKHLQYLNEVINFMIARLDGRPWEVSLDGFASHGSSTSDAGHNQILSEKREQETEKFLRKGIGSSIPAHLLKFNTKFHGFEQSPLNLEIPAFRSVRIAVHRPGLPPPPLPPPKPPGSTLFQIRLVKSVSFNAGFGAGSAEHDEATFEITDLAAGKTATYHYRGAGRALGFPSPPLIPSVTRGGPFRVFFTSKPVELTDFAGDAEYTQDPLAAHLQTKSALLRAKGATTLPPGSIEVPTGPSKSTTISSTTRGSLTLRSIL